MFRCRLRFNWLIYEAGSYQYSAADSRVLAKMGAQQFALLFEGEDAAVRQQVLGDGPLPLAAPNGAGVELSDITNEIGKRLALLPKQRLAIVAFGKSAIPPYQYRLDPPECLHTYLLKRRNGNTLDDVSFGPGGAAEVRAKVCATLEFWEVA